MKKIFIAFAVVLLFATCKKDSSSTSTTTPPVTLLNATGSWSLYSSNDSYFSIGKVTADQYPCIADNILTFKSDSTYSSSYTGTDICYVTASHAVGSSVTMGMPGATAETGTWRRNGNDIYVGTTGHYAISNVSGKLVLNFNTSFIISGTNYTATAVYYKQ